MRVHCGQGKDVEVKERCSRLATAACCLFSLLKALLISVCYCIVDAADIGVNSVEGHCRKLEREA